MFRMAKEQADGKPDYVVTDGSDKPRRVCVRGPSYTHAIALLQDLIVNVDIADVPGLMTSLHTCPPEIER